MGELNDLVKELQENKREISNNEIKPMSVEPVYTYQKETVEHLVDQLIKLQQEYNRGNMGTGYGSRAELDKAMKTVNKAIEAVLLPCVVLK